MASKYNLIANFLQGYDKQTREFLSYLIDGMIPGMKSIDEIENMIEYLQSLEHSVMEIMGQSKKPQDTHCETKLKLRLGKPSIDWLLDNYSEAVDLSKTSTLDEAIAHSIDS